MSPGSTIFYVTDKTNLGFCTDKVNPIREFDDENAHLLLGEPKIGKFRIHSTGINSASTIYVYWNKSDCAHIPSFVCRTSYPSLPKNDKAPTDIMSIPSTFLPHLPRSQYTLQPLNPTELLSHIALLRELYLPPIHGGFHAADVFDDEDESRIDASEESKKKGRQVKKEIIEIKRKRRFSAGLVETMEGMGLGLDVELPANPETIIEDKFNEEKEDSEEKEDTEVEYEELETPHLDPFEREWAEKWLSGVVRRAQGWLEENENDEKTDKIKETEAILRDATAVLAMMAGTSGMF